MPYLSIFTPLGALELSGETPMGQKIFEARRRALGYGTPDRSFDFTEGTLLDGYCYAAAMLDAGQAAYLKRAADQAIPSRTVEALPIREREYGIVPAAGDTVADRQAAYEARRLAPEGARYTNVVESLRTLLGDAFVAYRTTLPAEIVTYPTALGDQPMNLQLPEVPRKLVTVTPAISVLGAQTVAYAVIDQPIDPEGQAITDLLVGDTLVVDPGKMGIEERVVVTAVASGTFTATFAKPHDAGALGTTAPYPRWSSTQRRSFVVVTEAPAVDPETRRKIHDAMRGLTRSVSTWAIVPASGDSAGPFIPGFGIPGVTPVEALTL